jgi:hypothetical protein
VGVSVHELTATGKAHSLPCDSWMEVKGLRKTVASTLSVSNPAGFGVFEVLSSGHERSVFLPSLSHHDILFICALVFFFYL